MNIIVLATRSGGGGKNRGGLNTGLFFRKECTRLYVYIHIYMCVYIYIDSGDGNDEKNSYARVRVDKA